MRASLAPTAPRTTETRLPSRESARLAPREQQGRFFHGCYDHDAMPLHLLRRAPPPAAREFGVREADRGDTGSTK